MSFFITLEGIEGSGKTTQIALLAAWLREQGREVVQTREPGGCGIADAVRAILLDSANSAMKPRTELLLYAAARAQHVEEVVRPALARGAVVLCDRFTDATLAYQGYGRGLELQLIENLNAIAAGACRPDLTLLLDLPVEAGLGRALARIAATSGEREDRFEREALAFHQRVREGYLELARREPGRFRVVSAEGPPAAVAERLTQGVAVFMQEHGAS